MDERLRGTRFERAHKNPTIKITVEGPRGGGKSYLIDKIEKFLATQDNCMGVSVYSDGRTTEWGESSARTIKIVERDRRNYELDALIVAAAAAVDAMSPEEREEMYRRQRESWGRQMMD